MYRYVSLLEPETRPSAAVAKTHLGLLATGAAAGGTATVAATSTSTALTAEATAAAATVVAATVVTATAARDGLEAIVGVSRGGSLYSCQSFRHTFRLDYHAYLGNGLRLVISPRLGVGSGSRGSFDRRLGLLRVAGDVDPFLRSAEILTSSIPLLSGSIGGVGDLGVGRGLSAGLLGDVPVGQGSVVAGPDLGEGGVGDGRVRGSGLGSLGLSLGSSQGLVELDGDILQLGVSGLAGLAINGDGRVSGAARQLEDAVHGALVASVHAQEDALNCQVLIAVRVALLGAARGGKTQELREVEEGFVELLVVLAREPLLLLLQCVGDGLLAATGGRLLELGALSLCLGLELALQLLKLTQLLLKLGDLGGQGRLALQLGLLVGIDDLLGDQIVERLVGVSCNMSFGLGDVGLGECQLCANPGWATRQPTSFLFRLRRVLRNQILACVSFKRPGVGGKYF